MSFPRDPARRGMRRAALLGAALAALAAPSPAQAAPEVKIAPQSGKAVTVDLAELAGREDVRDRKYIVRSKKKPEDELAITGFSLRLILEEAGVKDDFFSVSVKGKGAPASLDKDAALDGGSGADGPPVIYVKGNDLGFLRPSTGPKDYNGDEAVGAAGSLTVAVITDATIDVKASASDRSVEKGDKVKFEAKADLPSGEHATYTWDFGDGDDAKGQNVDHTFKSEGTFSASVTAETRGGAKGTSDSVSVKVEDKKSKKDNKQGNGGSGNGNGSGGTGGTGSTGTGGSTTTTPEIETSPSVSDPPPVSSSPPLVSTPPPVSSSPPPVTSVPEQKPTKPPETEPPPTTATTPPPPSGDEVTGQLVTELPPGTPPPASGGSGGGGDEEDPESASPASPAPPDDPGSAEHGMLPVVAGLLISGVLLSGGAFLELRNPFHRRFT